MSGGDAFTVIGILGLQIPPCGEHSLLRDRAVVGNRELRLRAEKSMALGRKQVDELEVADLVNTPVWAYVEDDAKGAEVRPVRRLPVRSLVGKVVGSKVTLSNGDAVWALIGNVDVRDARSNQHFCTLSIERDGRWFKLARYHDLDFERRGPAALADFLGLQVRELFPIRYDLRRYAVGDPNALTGSVEAEPRERLSEDELMTLAIGCDEGAQG